MENVTDALKMAGSVLLFVIALSVVIPVIGQAKSTADAVMQYSDRAADAITAGEEGEDAFYYVSEDTTLGPPKKYRTVEVGDVIPTIYRSFAEDFKVVFLKSINNDFDNNLIIKNTEPGGNTEPLLLYKYNKEQLELNRIDLKMTSIANGDEKQERFIQGILFGLKNLNPPMSQQKFESDSGTTLIWNEIINGDGLYRLFKKLPSNKRI